MMTDYPLTLDHVKQFLKTKQDDDELGICYNSLYCLLSETLNWLYPEKKLWRVDITQYSARGIRDIDLSQNMLRLRIVFDMFKSYSHKKDAILTKAVFREYLQDEGKICKLPFPISSLFEEVATAQKG